MGDETTRSAAATALLVLVACHLASALTKLSPPVSADDDPAARVEPAGYAASVASTVVAAYVASAAWKARKGRGLSVDAFLAQVGRTWMRPAMTALYIELLTTAMASLLLTLRAVLAAAAGDAAAGLFAVTGSAALAGWFVPLLLPHSDIACRMSVVVAAVEDEGCGGSAAVERAEALVAGRRARSIAMSVLGIAVELAAAWLCGDGAPAFVAGLAALAGKLVACYGYAAFYYDCRNRLEKNGSTCGEEIEHESSYMVDETEREELDRFGFFRLT